MVAVAAAGCKLDCDSWRRL